LLYVLVVFFLFAFAFLGKEKKKESIVELFRHILAEKHLLCVILCLFVCLFVVSFGFVLGVQTLKPPSLTSNHSSLSRT